MNSSPHLLLGLVVSLALLFLSPSAQVLNSKSDTTEIQQLKLKIIHVYGPDSPFRPSNMSREKIVLQMQSNDLARQQYLEKSTSPVGPGGPNLYIPPYLVEAQFGTPPQIMLMGLDTGGDLCYLPCSGCVGCPSTTFFDPAKSASYRTLSCEAYECKDQVQNPSCGGENECMFTFNKTYFDNSSMTLKLSTETLTLGFNTTIADFRFGCINSTSGVYNLYPNGIMGLGEGPLSLLNQASYQYSLHYTFSYCLPNYFTDSNINSSSPSGSLILGLEGQPNIPDHTLMMINPVRPALAYVNLIGIMVGNVSVQFDARPLSFDPETGGGTVFDTGTDFTRLAEPVYAAVRDEFRNQVGSELAVPWLGGFDTCYFGPINAPTMTFLFSGMNMTLNPENILIFSPGGDNACLAMTIAKPSIEGNEDSVLNVIGSFQQQNHRVIYDKYHDNISVAPEQCS